jgi:hypothetical protein
MSCSPITVSARQRVMPLGPDGSLAVQADVQDHLGAATGTTGSRQEIARYMQTGRDDAPRDAAQP